MTNETFYKELQKKLKSFNKLFKMVEGNESQEIKVNMIKLEIMEQMQKLIFNDIEEIKKLEEENKKLLGN